MVYIYPQQRPSDIRYTQDSVKNTFTKPDEHEGKFIGETLDELCNGDCTVDDIEPIEVFWDNGCWWSSDNRRLWVLRHFQRLGGCDTVPVREINRNRMDPRKFTTENGGIEVRVRGYRGDPGGQWHRRPDKSLLRRQKQASKPRNNSRQNSNQLPAYNQTTSSSGRPASKTSSYSSQGHIYNDDSNKYISQSFGIGQNHKPSLTGGNWESAVFSPGTQNAEPRRSVHLGFPVRQSEPTGFPVRQSEPTRTSVRGSGYRSSIPYPNHPIPAPVPAPRVSQANRPTMRQTSEEPTRKGCCTIL